MKRKIRWFELWSKFNTIRRWKEGFGESQTRFLNCNSMIDQDWFELIRDGRRRCEKEAVHERWLMFEMGQRVTIYHIKETRSFWKIWFVVRFLRGAPSWSASNGYWRLNSWTCPQILTWGLEQSHTGDWTTRVLSQHSFHMKLRATPGRSTMKMKHHLPNTDSTRGISNWHPCHPREWSAHSQQKEPNLDLPFLAPLLVRTRFFLSIIDAWSLSTTSLVISPCCFDSL